MRIGHDIRLTVRLPVHHLLLSRGVLWLLPSHQAMQRLVHATHFILR